MGYDTERFVGRVAEALLCCVCRDVLEDPLLAPCEHAFCGACIHGWLVHNHSCPEDRQPLHAFELRPLFRYMRNDLNALRLHCGHRERGCEGVCALEAIASHELHCPYSPTPCPHAGCGAVLNRRDVAAHAASCRLGEPSPGDEAVSASRDPRATPVTLHLVPELRAELHLLRSEMECWVGELRHEMEARLDTQRRHMVHKEGLLMDHITELKAELCRASREAASLWHELERARQESRELAARYGTGPPDTGASSLPPARTAPAGSSPGSAALAAVSSSSLRASPSLAPPLAGRVAALSCPAAVPAGNVKGCQQDIRGRLARPQAARSPT